MREFHGTEMAGREAHGKEALFIWLHAVRRRPQKDHLTWNGVNMQPAIVWRLAAFAEEMSRSMLKFLVEVGVASLERCARGANTNQGSKTMKNHATFTSAVTGDIDAMVTEAGETVGAGFERFCVMAGVSSLQKMMGEDAAQLAGQRYERNPEAAVPAVPGSGLTRPAMSRRFKALTQARFIEWMSSDLPKPDILVTGSTGCTFATIS